MGNTTFWREKKRGMKNLEELHTNTGESLMVVSPNEELRRHIGESSARHNCQLEFTAGGAEALFLLEQRRYHGLLLDRGLRDLDVLIPLKVVSDSDLIPVAGSDVKPVVFGAKRRWRSYRA
jgi:hypothetical protein